MFARVITVGLKPGKASDYAALIDREVIPVMRTFAGFRDQMTLISPDGRRLVAISVWNSPEAADIYNREGYPKAVKTVEPFLDGTPVLVSYNVAVSTVHGIKSALASGATR